MLHVLLDVTCGARRTDVKFGYTGQPLLFTNINFGIDMQSRGQLGSFGCSHVQYYLVMLQFCNSPSKQQQINFVRCALSAVTSGLC